MKVYQLTGKSIVGSEDWPYNPIYSTPEKAEKQKQCEIDAYTKVNGVVMYECPYIFTINEIEVR